MVHTYAAAPSTRWLISVPTYLSYFFDRLTSGFPLLSRGRAITPIDVSGYSFHHLVMGKKAHGWMQDMISRFPYLNCLLDGRSVICIYTFGVIVPIV